MGKIERFYGIFVFLLLSFSLLIGLTTAVSFLYPENLKEWIPFQQFRPMHVSAALFWIISAASLNIFLHNQSIKKIPEKFILIRNVSIMIWIGTIITIFFHYGANKFGGREYWEFPGWIAIPLLLSWIGFCIYYFIYWKSEKDKRPQYIIMWGTGFLFFLFTFIEQNLWQISWFRQSFLQEMTIQWKANGSMVGAWNQMIYGTAFYLMVKISGNAKMAYDKKAIVFYFIGFTNLIFNWGHHIYNLPTHNWIRHVSYVISMTEWILFVNIIQGFRKTLEEHRRFKHLLTYRFLISAEFWVFLNLLLALFMSIPAVNRYTHGTHITVAHAMGTTIGINTMILLGSFAYLFKLDELKVSDMKRLRIGFNLVQISLFFFWISLITAGVFEGYSQTYLGKNTYAVILQPVMTCLKLFTLSGLSMIIGFGMILPFFFRAIYRN